MSARIREARLGARRIRTLLGLGALSMTLTVLATACDSLTGPAAGPPEAADVTLETAKNDALTIRLTGTDPLGEGLDFLIVEGPGHGALSGVTPTAYTVAEATYTPDLGFSGTDGLVYEVEDGEGRTAAGEVTIEVVNTPPVALSATATRPASGGGVTIELRGRDDDGDELTFFIVSPPASGSLGDIEVVGTEPAAVGASGADGSGVAAQAGEPLVTVAVVVYTPDPDAEGGDGFTFGVSDGEDDSSDSNGSDSGPGEVVIERNRPPSSAAVSVETGRNVPVQVSLIADDEDGDELAFEIADGPEHGTVGEIEVLDRTEARVRYTPADGFVGGDAFTVRVDDGLDEATGTVNVSVTNGEPDAEPVETEVARGAEIDLTLTGSDPDGDPLTFEIAEAPSGGEIVSGPETVDATTARVTYRAPDAGTDDRFRFRVSDGVDDATAPVTVVFANEAPTAEDQTVEVAKNRSIRLTLRASDPDEDALEFRVVDGPAHGTAGEVTSTGATTAEVTYTPEDGFDGADELRFVASDGEAESEPATVTLTVANAAPTVVSADAPRAALGSTVTITLQGSDPDGDVLDFEVVSGPSAGTVGAVTIVSNAQSTMEFTAPDAGGPVTFDVTASDGTAESDPFTVTVPVNHRPVAQEETAETGKDAAVTIELEADDADGDEPTLEVSEEPDHGTLSALTATGPGTAEVVYTPDPGFVGTDRFEFTADDGLDVSTPAPVTVEVVNAAPTADPATGSVDEDAVPVTLTLTGSDPDGEALTFSIATPPANGTLGAVTGIDATTAEVEYTPDPDFFGDDPLDFTVEDGSGATSTATITVTVDPVNDAPSFTSRGDVTSLEDAVVSQAWAADISAGPSETTQSVSFDVTDNTNAGLFAAGPSVAADGTLTFTPAADANGSAEITVELMDDGGTANGGVDTAPEQTFTITVEPVNDAPSFTKGADVTVLEDSGPFSEAGWAGGFDPGPADESGQTLQSYDVTNDDNALFADQPAISTDGELTFTPADDAFGSATVTVSVTDDGGTANGGVDTSADQTFTITVEPVNDAPGFTSGGDVTVDEDSGPHAEADWASDISEGPASESGQILTFDVTNDDNALFSAQPAVAADGTLTFTPADDANGSAEITVELSDDGGTADGGVDTSPEQTFTITVTPVNDAPTFTTAGDQSVLEDAGAQTVAGWADDISVGPADEAGQTITGFSVSNDNNALFSAQPAISTAGELTYTPAADAFGSAEITVELSDDGGTANGGSDTSTATFTITVEPVNEAPSFTSGGDVTSLEDEVVSQAWAEDISKGPTNEDGQTLTFDVTDNTNAGLFAAGPSVAADGTLTYTPAADAHGSAEITIELSDDGGTANSGVDTSPEQTFTITVTPVNDAPSFTSGGDVTVDDSGGPVSQAWATDISVGPADEDGQTITGFDVSTDNNALFDVQPAIAADGTLTFTPVNVDSETSATVTVTVSDDGGTANGGDDTSAEEFTITVRDVIAYVTHGSSVSVIDVASSTVTSTIGVGSGAHRVAFTPDGSTAYVTNEDSDNVSVIDVASESVSKTIDLGEFTEPRGLAFTPDGSAALVGVAEPKVLWIDVATGTVTDAIEGEGIVGDARSIRIGPDGSTAYVASASSSSRPTVIPEVSLGSRSVIRTIETCVGGTLDLAITPDEATAIVAGFTFGVSCTVDLASGEVTEQFADHGFSVALTPDGSTAYIPQWEGPGVVKVIDVANEEETGRIDLGVSLGGGGEITPDGSTLYAVHHFAGTVSVIDLASEAVTATITVGDPAWHVAFLRR